MGIHFYSKLLYYNVLPAQSEYFNNTYHFYLIKVYFI